MSNASGVSCAPPAPTGTPVPPTPANSFTADPRVGHWQPRSASLAERRDASARPPARPPARPRIDRHASETGPDHARADGPQSLVRRNRRLHLVTRMHASAARVSYGRLGCERLLDTAPGVQEQRGGASAREDTAATECYWSMRRLLCLGGAASQAGGFCRP